MSKNQIIRKNKIKNKNINNNIINKPQIKGIVLKAFVMKPKKPNSALRKIARVSTKYGTFNAYIPGIGHNITTHSVVLIKKGKTQDCPSVTYKVIRGKLDCSSVSSRITSRSKYGKKY